MNKEQLAEMIAAAVAKELSRDDALFRIRAVVAVCLEAADWYPFQESESRNADTR